jgi:hypothetical protein
MAGGCFSVQPPAAIQRLQRLPGALFVHIDSDMDSSLQFAGVLVPLLGLLEGDGDFARVKVDVGVGGGEDLFGDARQLLLSVIKFWILKIVLGILEGEINLNE